jgi:hypothetical protein
MQQWRKHVFDADARHNFLRGAVPYVRGSSATFGLAAADRAAEYAKRNWDQPLSSRGVNSLIGPWQPVHHGFLGRIRSRPRAPLRAI